MCFYSNVLRVFKKSAEPLTCLTPKIGVCSLPLLSFHFLFTFLRHNLRIMCFVCFMFWSQWFLKLLTGVTIP